METVLMTHQIATMNHVFVITQNFVHEPMEEFRNGGIGERFVRRE